jgi:hypothetical protein
VSRGDHEDAVPCLFSFRTLQLGGCFRNVNEHIEIGAEVFAAEFIFPEQDFLDALAAVGVTFGACSPEAIVRLKRSTRTTLSYAGLAKRAVFFGLARVGSLDGIQWKRLEETIFGEPLYKKLLRRRSQSPVRAN